MSSPFGKKTPESYFSGLRRKDSKNALTTCHGVTSNGRACRRALSSPKNSSKFDGAVVITDNDSDPAVFFCWQHRDQADSASADGGSVVELKGRHSLEEAFQSLGLEDVVEGEEESLEEVVVKGVRLREPRRTVAVDFASMRTLPSASQESFDRPPIARRKFGNPRYSEPESLPLQRKEKRVTSIGPTRARKPSTLSSLFSYCFTSPEVSLKSGRRSPRENGPRIARPKPMQSYDREPEMRQTPTRSPRRDYETDFSGRRTSDSPRVREGKISSHRRSDSGIDTPPSDPLNPRRVSEKGRSTTRKAVPKATRPGLQVYRDSAPEQPTQNTYLQPRVSELQSTTGRPSTLRAKSTPDPQQLNRIHGEWPPPLPRNATDSVRIAYAKLLTAMSEPPTKGDSPGYIYIFWQTDTEQTDDETSAVASIISAPADRGLHRQETILQRRFFQTSANARSFHPVEKRTIFLKIGRAANVHQRLSQWKKQCDYDITLLRIYPYDPDRREAARKVIYVGKVERLIHLHLEMLGQRVSKRCRCGTEHKEWFEVEATTRGIRDVDEIVRKWVQWSEDRFGV